VSKDYEVIGIDVDHYTSGGKEKRGGDQLKTLEERLGILPATWISSARTDGTSGIRYYRVPRGLAFRGKIDKDIECIQKGHRFAVVWPSKHPDGGTYTWFEPNADLTIPPAKVEIPDARKLPELPESWLRFLTQDKMSASDVERIDMDSSVDEIYKWADATFHGDSDTEMCSTMGKKLDGHKKSIEEDATSHDKIVNAHFNLLSLAAEGHLGWVKAVNEIEQFWVDDVISRDKRSRDELVHEIWRSRTNALRKIKAKVDGRVAIGAAGVDSSCQVTGLCGNKGQSLAGVVSLVTGQPNGGTGDPLDDVPRGATGPVGEYRMNDDGNAEHFVDMFSSISGGIGASVRYAKGRGWIVWHEGDNPHWELDQDGDQEMRRMWQMVRNAQENYVDNALYPAYIADLTNFQNGTGGITANDVKASKTKYEKWRRFSEISGNNRNAESAILAVASRPGVSIDLNVLDANPYLIGVKNGVLELDGENVRLRKARAIDYITLNTGVPWEKPSDFASGLWRNYLSTFLPDPELQRAVQVILGHCLVGGNPEKVLVVLKGGTNTGKSTMIAVIEAALGEYAGSINPTVFQSHKFNATLVGALPKRIVMCSEFEESDNLSAAMIKRITGGNDVITQEVKFSNAVVSGVPQFVAILPTNETPAIEGNDEALKNRLLVIPFDVTPAKIDKQASTIVRNTCATAVLHWLVEGYMEYRRLGFLPRVTAMEEATEEFTAELDEVATFARDVLQSHSDRKKIHHLNMPEEWCVQSGNLYARFEQWWRDNKMPEHQKPSIIRFVRRMKALGFQCVQRKIVDTNGKFWVGVKIKSRIDRDVIPMGQSLSTVVSSLTGKQGRSD
jgi:P4 family phage/plasmid primase-like protien